ncbi:MAG: glycosyltransferase family 4 protein [Candidatus Saccharimonadales bacterium]
MRGGIDVVHANDGLMAVPGYFLAKLFRKRFTVNLHGLDITYTNPLFKAAVPWAVRRADHVFCISRAAAEEAVKRGASRSKVEPIPLAVKDELYVTAKREQLIEQLWVPPDTRILLTVGRLVERKGAAWFIDEVMPGLVKQHPKLLYVIVGEGEARPAIEAAVKRRGLDGHVRLTGRLDGQAYAAAYNGADVFIMPNVVVPGDMEGFGLVLLEASLCARPVVAAGIEGILDAVADGKNGVLVPTRDAGAFAVAIDRFLSDKAYAKRFGDSSRRFTLENYQWPAIADRYVAAYKQLLG